MIKQKVSKLEGLERITSERRKRKDNIMYLPWWFLLSSNFRALHKHRKISDFAFLNIEMVSMIADLATLQIKSAACQSPREIHRR